MTRGVARSLSLRLIEDTHHYLMLSLFNPVDVLAFQLHPHLIRAFSLFRDNNFEG